MGARTRPDAILKHLRNWSFAVLEREARQLRRYINAYSKDANSSRRIRHKVSSSGTVH